MSEGMNTFQIVYIDPQCSRMAHPVMECQPDTIDRPMFGQCVLEIDPCKGRSDICPHGYQARWENWSRA